MRHSGIRENIIKTASNLFYRNGYNSTGINQIISESGIAKATLYSHFKSKEDLGKEYVKYKNDAFIINIAHYSRRKEKGINQVLAIFDFLQVFFDSEDFNGCWCVNTISEIPINNQKIRNEIQHQKNKFIDLIKALITENLESITPEEVTKTARRIYLIYEGAVVESHLHREDWPIKEAKEICLKVIF